jgi:Bacteriophage lambda head decoration protein D
MTVKTESIPRDGGFILSELETYSREVITLSSGQNLKAGTVLAVLGSGEYAAIDFAGTGTADDAAAILFQDTDASAADKATVAMVRGPCEVMRDKLVWPDGATAQNKTDALDQLEALGIIARSGPETVQIGPSV